MAWSIAEVARTSGVTSRTLRHYDALGLVRPAYVSAGGVRWYEQQQLLRLQRVLLLRELGLGLAAVAQVLAGERDEVEALRAHAQRLHREADRLRRVAETADRTAERLGGGAPVSAEDVFEGFAERARFEEELVGRHGEGVREHFRDAERRTEGWTAQDYARLQREWQELDARFAALLARGVAPDAPEAQALVAEHHRAVARSWTPDREGYTGLGRTYVEDPRFRERYDAVAPGLAEYLRDAMAVHAERALA
ncbi:MerR family transcriptional regulator [Vallicoccus soli]|uniref:MerR family transcriptional regulator n=1 Tax=Vallicoccus soli TaxID=2339232 RepID=A0A3A3Z474_9ACTN|nr:TipAS antibiotic-recognition domain-containing protein [Vallicoccus soli]RJK95347.1 MerR family transcriptional regulator [Vallicoccus soli]